MKFFIFSFVLLKIACGASENDTEIVHVQIVIIYFSFTNLILPIRLKGKNIERRKN